MKYYWVKTHRLIKWVYSRFIWDIPNRDRIVYLTFDDGPTPQITEWVLSQLEAFQAKATFFCIGHNIANHTGIFQKVITGGHTIGNHTQHHVNGWHVDDDTYDQDVLECENIMEKIGVKTNLFRPPYGKLTRKQARKLLKQGYKIIMWDILSADFDAKITPEKCLENVLKNVSPGSIIIFHDSVKAFHNLEFVLPKTLAYLKENGYKCEAIT